MKNIFFQMTQLSALDEIDPDCAANKRCVKYVGDFKFAQNDELDKYIIHWGKL